MRRLVLLFGLLAAPLLAAGCKNTTGPLAAHQMDKAEDPFYPKDQWRARDRERSARPEDTGLTPSGLSDRPSPSGR